MTMKTLLLWMSHRYNFAKLWYVGQASQQIFASSEVLQTFEFNPVSANPRKWSSTLKQLVGKLPTNCLCVLDHFVKLVLKGLIWSLDFQR